MDIGWGNLFLIFIDPTGYAELQWEDIDSIFYPINYKSKWM